MAKHSHTRMGNGEYSYRGHRITRDDGVRAGFFGRWNARIGGRTWGYSHLDDAKAAIDHHFVQQDKLLTTMCFKPAACALASSEVIVEYDAPSESGMRQFPTLALALAWVDSGLLAQTLTRVSIRGRRED